VDEVGKETAVLLMEILDRIEIPVIEQVPGARQIDAEKVDESKLTSWTIPETAITITQVPEGPRRGEFLFSPETVSRVKEFYDRVEHLPYKDGTVLEDAYHVYLQAPGPMIPISAIMRMPASLKLVEFGHPVWKWLALTIVLALLLGGLVLAFLIGSRNRGEGERVPFLRRVVFPISGILLALLAQGAFDQINLGKDVVYFTSILVTLITAISQLWLVIALTNAVAEWIVASPRINPRSIDAQMVRVCFRLFSVGAFVFIVLRTAHNLGIPLTPVLAGLGVGGIAVALAAQNSLENLIGGFNLFTDRPIRVGDFCRFGQRIGTVEEIGLRSTRVRSLDDTVISIPNSSFSKMELENFAKRTKVWYHPRIQLAKSATPDQVRFVLVEVRKMLYSHPKVDPKPARIRFVEFGTSSLDLDIFAYVSVTDYGEYLGVAEDLNLRIMEIVSRAGTSLAVPVQRTLLERVPEPAHDRVQQVEQQVRTWRENDQLYLPSFPEDVVAQMRNSLPYPPTGAPPS
jgi:MscS family membrane protein